MDGVRGARSFGEELRRLRSERGISLTALARSIHYSKGYLSKIENGGKPPTPDVARRCDEALGAGGALVRLVADVPPARRPMTPSPQLPGPAGAVCPYRGLAAFGPEHAQWLFGRERATAELVGKLAERAGSGPLAVVASSGAGKSSLLRAGLVPALRRGALPVEGSSGWPVVVCTPTAHPLKELLRCVTEVLGAGFGVDPESLRVRPRAMADAVRPLLAAGPGRPHALLVTWQQRTGRTLTVAGYETTGGIHGAIARTAEAVFTRLRPAEQEMARRVLVRLVQVGAGDGGDGSGDSDAATRRRASRELLLEQLPDRRGVEAALDAFVRARLITVDSDAVEITHEALLRAWPRLRGWIGTNRAGLLIHQRLAGAAAEWVRADRDPGLLYRGTRLAAVQEWAEQTDGRAELATYETEFLDASRAQEEAGKQAARRQVRTHRRLLVLLGALLVLALLAGGTAFHQRSRAVDERRIAQSQAMAVRSGALASGQPEASMRLAAEAYRTAPTTEARGALLSTQAQYFAGRLGGHTGPANGVAFSPGDKLLASASSDGTVRLWGGVDHRTPVDTLTGHGGPVVSVAFSPDGRLIASAGYDGSVRLWGVADRQPAGTLLGHGGAVRSVAFGPGGRSLVSGGADGTVRLWDVGRRQVRATLRGHGDSVHGVAFSADGRTVVSGSSDRTVRIWDVARRAVRATLSGHSDGILGVAFSPDGRSVASGSADRTVRIWDVRRHRLLATLTGHTGSVFGIAFSPDGHLLASASADRTVRLWDVRRHRLLTTLTTLTGHQDFANAVAFSPDGKMLAVGGDDLTVRLWSVADRRSRAVLRGHTGSVRGVAYSRDGRTLASSGNDGTVRLWDTTHHRPAATLTGHSGAVRAVAFDPGAGADAPGTTLASSGSDGTVRLWDTTHHRLTATLTGHSGAVWGVVFDPRSRALVSSSNDGTVRLWTTDVRAVSRGVSRFLARQETAGSSTPPGLAAQSRRAGPNGTKPTNRKPDGR
ncbi:helix-turn-helix domain-containing protein [Streptomyces flavidovirens]|uniref:nSTAND1 domain-containing NTPase n=1 Tax=Streptomyces flavidovirens TaxID=67298 RepID=UPI00041C39E6|nr:helix-turn-helix domain-containing protein [Streptomyces flavidovirens]